MDMRESDSVFYCEDIVCDDKLDRHENIIGSCKDIDTSLHFKIDSQNISSSVSMYTDNITPIYFVLFFHLHHLDIAMSKWSSWIYFITYALL